MYEILNQDHPAGQSLHPGVAAYLRLLLGMLLHKNRSKRIETAKNVIDRLRWIVRPAGEEFPCPLLHSTVLKIKAFSMVVDWGSDIMFTIAKANIYYGKGRGRC